MAVLPPTDESTCASSVVGPCTHVAGGGKARHVAHHAAAQRVERGLAVEAAAEQRVKDQVERIPGLELLAVGKVEPRHCAVATRQHPRQRVGVQGADCGVGDDQRRRARTRDFKRRRIAEQTGADGDVVAAITQVDADVLCERRAVHVGSV